MSPSNKSRALFIAAKEKRRPTSIDAIGPGNITNPRVINNGDDLTAVFSKLGIGFFLLPTKRNNTCYYLIKYCSHPELTFIKGSDSEDFDCAKSAIIYMEKNYSKAIPLSEIADYVGMTPAHFSAYFKDKTEVTFSRYLRKIRLDHALEDMRKNNASVKAAALNNGFPNVNSLIITCKEEFGRTPLEMKHFAST